MSIKLHPITVALAFVFVFFGMSAQKALAKDTTLKVTFTNETLTLDPAIAYDWQNYDLSDSIFSGLLALYPPLSQPKLDLAEFYNISKDQKSYTFQLRKGATFHNGRAITASDVKFSIERVINPRTLSPAFAFFKSIKGYDKFRSGKVSTLESIKVINSRQIQFNLAYKDKSFLYALAINFGAIVPKEEALKRSFTYTPSGSGPFKLISRQKGKMVLERFDNYKGERFAKSKRLEILTGINPVQASQMLKQGKVHVIGDDIPFDRVKKVLSDPRYKQYVWSYSASHTSYLAMNVNKAPFDDVLVRKAIYKAINRKNITKYWSGIAKPTNQILPKNMDGHDSSYRGEKLNITKAKQLLTRAGYSKGFKATLVVLDKPPYREIGDAIRKDLARIGIDLTVRKLNEDKTLKIAGNPNHKEIVFSGGLGWIADYPAPSNFYHPLFSTESAASEGSWNWSFYHNPKLDAIARKADTYTRPSERSQRINLWKYVFIKIMDDMPVIPLYSKGNLRLTSPDIINRKASLPNGFIRINYHQLQHK